MVVSIQVIVGHREGEVTGMADGLVMCLKSSWIVLWCLNGDIISPQELAVGKGDSTGSINLYYILVKLVDLNDDACLVALVGMWTCLILNLHWWPTARGGNLLVCTVHHSASFMHLLLRASSLALECQLQVG